MPLQSGAPRTGALGVAVVSALLAASACIVLAEATEAIAGPRADAQRLPIHAARRGVGTPLPWIPAGVADERRYALASSGREQLALRPAQVGAGGRVFVFAKVPAELADDDFLAEFLVWKEGRWQRNRVMETPKGRLGHISATLIVEDLEPGAVATAVFRRTAIASKTQSIVSTAMQIPASARLKIGFSLDEWDWAGLGPVAVSVAAVITSEESSGSREVILFRRRVDPEGLAPTWFDAVVDLSAVAETQARLLFRAEPEAAGGRLPPHVVWSAPSVVYGKSTSKLPSVVVVLADGLRARSLGCCGGGPQASPFLDELFGTRGAIFEHAVTAAVDSIPAHMSLLTGTYPCAHGVLSAKSTLSHDVETFAQVMANAGYATAAFTDSAGLAAELGFGRGFETYYQDSSLDRWNVQGTAGPTFERAARWLEAHTGEPFLLIIHTIQAKPPYVPPVGYLDLFKGADSGLPGASKGERLRYQREVRYLDDALRGFVSRLDAASAPDRTLLVVTSAHGEEFLEHGAREHGAHLYEESIRVPLLVRGAGVKSGVRYEEVVGLIDVAPTILEIAGLSAPTTTRGSSIAKQLRGRLPLSLPARFSEAHGNRRRLATGDDTSWKPPAYSVSTSQHKLIAYVAGDARVNEAYDLVADPSEAVDLIGSDASARPPWVARLKSALEAYTKECRRAAHAAEPTDTLPVGVLFKLKAFGYL